MLLGVILGLIVAWILSLFGVDQLLINGIPQLTGIEIDLEGYYTIFAFIGLFGGIFNRHK